VQIFLPNDLNHPPITVIYAKLKASGVFFEQITTSGMYIVATLALGSRPKQRGCKVAGQEEGSPGVKAKALQRCRPRRSPGVTSQTPGGVRKCEGVNPHTPKATPTLGDGVSVDSQNFKERL